MPFCPPPCPLTTPPPPWEWYPQLESGAISADASPIVMARVICSVYIFKIHISQWEPPGVSERIWNVNWEKSISREYQTQEEHSGRASEWMGLRLTGAREVQRWLSTLWAHIGALVRTLGESGSITKLTWESPTNSERCCSVYRYSFAELQAVWDSSYIHEKSTSLNGKNDARIIVHCHFWIIQAIVVSNILSFALLH